MSFNKSISLPALVRIPQTEDSAVATLSVNEAVSFLTD